MIIFTSGPLQGFTYFFTIGIFSIVIHTVGKEAKMIDVFLILFFYRMIMVPGMLTFVQAIFF